MNVCVTNRCSRRCEYCFQREWFLESPERPLQEMPISLFKTALDIMQEQSIQLLGGEPLLYTHLDELFQICRERKITVSMLSNISVDTELFEKVVTKNHDVICGWLINSDYADGQEEMFLRNLQIVRKFFPQKNACLGMTIVPNPERAALYVRRMLNILSKTIKKGEVMKIRLSTTTPTGNDVYRTYDYSELLAQMANRINAEFPNVGFYFDCAPTFCEVNDDFYQRMGMLVKTSDRMFCSEPLIDVMPDGSVCWCSSAHFIRVPDIRAFSSGGEVSAALIKLWRQYWQEIGIDDRCRGCEFLSPAKCTGWCAAKIAEVKKFGVN